MTLEPLGERIIVRRKVTEKVGLIIKPPSQEKTSLQGEVIAVGPDAGWVNVGDKILFWHHSGFVLPSELNGYDNCLLMNNDDVLSKITENENG